MTRTMLRGIVVAALACAACGDDTSGERSAPPPKAPSSTAAPANSPVAKLAGPGTPQTKESLLAEVRKRQLTNEDFVESDNNRDPFRSYLATFAAQAPTITKQHKIILQKFALDELKLVAIVEGDGVTPRAMFVDPSGLGVNVVRGDHVSKADATATRIAPDRVFFEIEEDAGNGKSRKVERVIELHAGEIATQ